MTDKTGGPAFPDQGQRMNPDGKWAQDYAEGMSLRDYFAAHAPEPEEWYKKLFSGREKSKAGRDDMYIMRGPIECLAEWKFYYADAMIKERDNDR